jgi:prepilin signal peptidase PulO-like enzyme (type II secretory pathway)
MATADNLAAYRPLAGAEAGEQATRVPLLRNPLPTAAVAAGAAALSLAVYSAGSTGLIAAFMAIVLVAVAAIDLERRIIPNRVILPATLVVLVARVALFPDRVLEFLLAMLGAGFVFLVLNLVTRNGVGMGDVKLVAFIGAGLGTAVAGSIMLGCVSIFPFAVGTLMRGGLAARKTALPFGPFLAFGALLIIIVPRLLGIGSV